MFNAPDRVVNGFRFGSSAKVRNDRTDGHRYWLHDNLIAFKNPGGLVVFTLCDWPTPCTRSRLNCIAPGSFYQRKHVQYWQSDRYSESEPVALDEHAWYILDDELGLLTISKARVNLWLSVISGDL